jgi:hypothetical protein
LLVCFPAPSFLQPFSLAAETFDKLISAVPPRKLRLTPIDALISRGFRQLFPDLDIALLTESDLKSDAAKAKWRPFLMGFQGHIHDWSHATLLRTDASQPSGPENSIIVPRCQFYCIEVTRCLEGLNDAMYETAQAAKKASA